MRRLASLITALSLGLVPSCSKSTSDTEKPSVAPEGGPAVDPALAGAYTVTPPDQRAFKPVNPKEPEGAKIAPVFGDPMKDGASAFFLQIPAGSDAGVHSHSADYHAVVISGTPQHWLPGFETTKLGPGGYWMQPGNQPHGDKCVGDSDCVLLIVMNGRFDFAPKPDVTEIADRGDYIVLPPAAISYEAMDPSGKGPKVAILFGDPETGPVVFAMEVKPGFAAGIHKHTSEYHGVVLAGAWAHWLDGGPGAETGLPSGTYWYQPSGQFHDDACRGDQACRVLIIMPGPQDSIAKE